jgi:hypothetical protein
MLGWQIAFAGRKSPSQDHQMANASSMLRGLGSGFSASNHILSILNQSISSFILVGYRELSFDLSALSGVSAAIFSKKLSSPGSKIFPWTKVNRDRNQHRKRAEDSLRVMR